MNVISIFFLSRQFYRRCLMKTAARQHNLLAFFPFMFRLKPSHWLLISFSNWNPFRRSKHLSTDWSAQHFHHKPRIVSIICIHQIMNGVVVCGGFLPSFSCGWKTLPTLTLGNVSSNEWIVKKLSSAHTVKY